MNKQVIPAEAFDAAAEVFLVQKLQHEGEVGWSSSALIAALEAAAPYMLRSVWDEAYGRGFEAARGYPDTPNPYEEAL